MESPVDADVEAETLERHHDDQQREEDRLFGGNQEGTPPDRTVLVDEHSKHEQEDQRDACHPEKLEEARTGVLRIGQSLGPDRRRSGACRGHDLGGGEGGEDQVERGEDDQRLDPAQPPTDLR
jgi:hypothetical protein